MMTWLMLAAGLVLLVLGADYLVKGAARLAGAFGIPSLVIGLTVVAFGTSAPELAVSLKAAWTGQAELAIANVVGSNIFNVLFILGVAALIMPLVSFTGGGLDGARWPTGTLGKCGFIYWPADLHRVLVCAR